MTLRLIWVTLFNLQIRKVLLNQFNLVSGEGLIYVRLILGNCHILSNVNYLINIAVLSMDHRCGEYNS